MKCQVEKYCKKYPKYCNDFCEGYVLFDIVYKGSNIPQRYQYPRELILESIDINVYNRVAQIMQGVNDWVGSGNSLLLYGENKGNGKTTLACSIANKYIRDTCNSNKLESPVYFIKSAKFLEEVRSQFDNPDPAFQHIMKLVEIIPLLIIDDIGAEKTSDWVRERLLNLIDERYSNNRSTIYTSNCSLGQISESLGSRLADRLRECEMLQFKGTSKRGVK
jgi:DNA replication protein